MYVVGGRADSNSSSPDGGRGPGSFSFGRSISSVGSGGVGGSSRSGEYALEDVFAACLGCVFDLSFSLEDTHDGFCNRLEVICVPALPVEGAALGGS